MEELFTNIILLTILIGGGKVLIFHVLGKARQEMAASVNVKTNNKMDHYKYIYSQDDIYKSMYFDTQQKFNRAMRNGQLSNEQIKFIEMYLRRELNNHSHFKNNANAIYSMLKSPLLDNSNYSYLNQVIGDFTHC